MYFNDKVILDEKHRVSLPEKYRKLLESEPSEKLWNDIGFLAKMIFPEADKGILKITCGCDFITIKQQADNEIKNDCEVTLIMNMDKS